MDLKELWQEDLGGGIVLRHVEPTLPRLGHRERAGAPTAQRRLGHPFYLVTLTWEGTYYGPDGEVTDRLGKGVHIAGEPGGVCEARIFPPRPEDGPHGEGWLVTDLPPDIRTPGYFTSFIEAKEAVVTVLRQYDASRRLSGPRDRTTTDWMGR